MSESFKIFTRELLVEALRGRDKVIDTKEERIDELETKILAIEHEAGHRVFELESEIANLKVNLEASEEKLKVTLKERDELAIAVGATSRIRSKYRAALEDIAANCDRSELNYIIASEALAGEGEK